MKILNLLIATLLLCSVAGAQKTQNVVGVYSSGGSTLAFLPENKFVGVGMGTILTGTWEEEDQIFMSEIANSIGVPITSRDFSDEDEAGNWIPVSYPIVYHKLKELKQVTFDNRNLFRGRSPESYKK